MPKRPEELLREIQIPESGSITWSAPIISGDKLIFGSNDKHLYCLEKNTGKIIWKFLTGAAVTLPANIVDGKVYFSSLDKYHYCLSLKTGELLWKKLFPQWTGSPTFANNVLYVGCTDNNLYALEADTGNILWAFRTGGLVISIPSVINNHIYFGSFDKNFYCLDADGKLKWKFLTGDSIAWPAGVSDDGEQAWSLLDRNGNRQVNNGVLYFGSFDNYFYSLTLDGEFKWKFLAGNVISACPVIHNNILYFGSWDKNFYSLDAESGLMKWRFVTGGLIDTSASIHDNTAYFGSSDHNLYALNLDGKKVWTFTTGGIIVCPPVICDGILYVGSIDTFLYAIRLIDRKLLWKFQTGMPAGSYEQFFKDWTGIVEIEKKPFSFTDWKPETLKKSYGWKEEVGNIITSPYKSENPYMNKTTYRMEGSYETQQKKQKELWEK